MRTVLMLCPTRGRPAKALEALESFNATKTLKGSALVFLVDEDDPTLDQYLETLPAHNIEINESLGSMNAALNAAATLHASIGIYDYLGFIGDDHRFRTNGWDEQMVRGLESAGGGFAYGNDLYQSENLPTHILMSTSIVAALGWMGLPGARHLYLDNTWMELGQRVDRLFYFPNLIVEHMHPYAGKADMEEGYERVNSREMNDHDLAVFEDWKVNRRASDIELVRNAL
jgi:hypothetical protein